MASQKRYDVKLRVPLPARHRWQAKTGEACSINDFAIDWGAEQVTCPDDKKGVSWSERKDKRNDNDLNDNDLIVVLFAQNDCLACVRRARCHRATKQARSVAFKPKEKHEAFQAARRDQRTPERHALYSKHSSIEGTLSPGVRAFGLRRSRYVGQSKTQFWNIAVATASNTARLRDWLEQKPRSRTRASRFAGRAA